MKKYKWICGCHQVNFLSISYDKRLPYIHTLLYYMYMFDVRVKTKYQIIWNIYSSFNQFHVDDINFIWHFFSWFFLFFFSFFDSFSRRIYLYSFLYCTIQCIIPWFNVWCSCWLSTSCSMMLISYFDKLFISLF